MPKPGPRTTYKQAREGEIVTQELVLDKDRQDQDTKNYGKTSNLHNVLRKRLSSLCGQGREERTHESNAPSREKQEVARRPGAVGVECTDCNQAQHP